MCACVHIFIFLSGHYSAQNKQPRMASCYSKLSWLLLKIAFGLQISRRSCYSSPSYKIKNPMYLEYYIIIIAILNCYKLITTQLAICLAIFMQKLLLTCTKLFRTLMYI